MFFICLKYSLLLNHTPKRSILCWSWSRFHYFRQNVESIDSEKLEQQESSPRPTSLTTEKTLMLPARLYGILLSRQQLETFSRQMYGKRKTKFSQTVCKDDILQHYRLSALQPGSGYT
ncbi:hypothetical protein TNCT_215191 [Trichonephila clavata]|uniref:Uncharacterized protein n=1 Tax=Trichonephila clavata TaxID=2740835 RepID=A0A8X6K7Z0_TRICU|nr:hypothetical protein TNCT_215191 [Trichonephila clavata]